jgi:hypothetical protein
MGTLLSAHLAGYDRPDGLVDYLKRFNLDRALHHISSFINTLPHTYELLSKAQINHFQPQINSIKNEIDLFKMKYTAHRMLRFLLLSSANNYKSRVFVDDFGTALHVTFELENLFLATEQDPDSLIRLLMMTIQRQGLFSESVEVRLSRAFQLYVDIPTKLGLLTNYDEVMNDLYGCSMLDYLSVSFILSNFVGSLIGDFEEGNERWNHLTSILKSKRYLSAHSIDKEQYMKEIRGDDYLVFNAEQDMYSPDPMYISPMYHCESMNKYILLSKFMMSYKSTTGIIYSMCDHYRLNNPTQSNQLRSRFGDKVLREYVHQHLEQINEYSPVIDLDEDKEFANIMRPDYMILSDDICVLIEIKLNLIPIKVRTSCDKKYIVDAITNNDSNIHKAMQQFKIFHEYLDSTIGLTSRKMLKLLVSYDPLYASNKLFIPLINEVLGEEYTANLQIINLIELENIAITMQADQSVLIQLADKANSDRQNDVVFTFLNTLTWPEKYDGVRSSSIISALKAITASDSMRFGS